MQDEVDEMLNVCLDEVKKVEDAYQASFEEGFISLKGVRATVRATFQRDRKLLAFGMRLVQLALQGYKITITKAEVDPVKDVDPSQTLQKPVEPVDPIEPVKASAVTVEPIKVVEPSPPSTAVDLRKPSRIPSIKVVTPTSIVKSATPPQQAPTSPSPAPRSTDNVITYANISVLNKFLADLPEIVQIQSYVDWVRMVSSIERFMEDRDSWYSLPLDGLRDGLEYLILALRMCKDSPHCAESERVNKLIRILGGVASDTQCGIIYGLALHHKPRNESWYADAKAALKVLQEDPDESSPTVNADKVFARLSAAITSDNLYEVRQALRDVVLNKIPYENRASILKALGPHIDGILTSDSSFSGVRKAVIQALDTEDQGSDVQEDQWEHARHTLGKSAVIVGGDPRQHVSERVQEYFGFRQVTWDHRTPDRIKNLSARMDNNSVDFVIVLISYLSHSDSEALHREQEKTGTLYVPVPKGYGLKAIQQACIKALTQAKRI